MTVALMAQRHHRKRTTTLLAAGLMVLVVVGGITNARSVQIDLAADVQRALGATSQPVEITVDGLDVTLQSAGTIADEQRAAVGALPGIGSVTIVTEP